MARKGCPFGSELQGRRIRRISTPGGSRVRVASVDIGTNSLRLLVAELGEDSSLTRLHAERSIVRLGEGLTESGLIKTDRAQEAICVAVRFVGEARRWGAKRLVMFATSAVREARNGNSLVEGLEKSTGLQIRVLTGQEEAVWAMEGMKGALRDSLSEWLGVDIGGGSTEVFLVRGDGLERATSIPVGMVKLTDQYLSPGSMEEGARVRCAEACRSALKEMVEYLDPHKGTIPIVGSGGTITTLAALEAQMEEYDGDAIHGRRLTRPQVEKWIDLLAQMDIPSRRRLPGMEKGREDVILAGAILVREVLGICKAEELIVSDHGILEGACRMAPLVGQEL